ncbi:MAG TPA: uracil-DNA glycosylase [Usitatibacter sp.]|nr:uracil-DNA glycosylase [Usitatibacter sp.]
MDARSLKELGLLEVSRWYELDRPAADSGEAPPAEGVVAIPSPGAISSVAGADWDELRALVGACRACGLCRQRKQAVFGVGAQSGPWLFVGEGPGADEDEQGEPFVGQAGKLLDNMLAAIGCRRGVDTYIANVVKCRPPGNRTPTAEEAAACAPFLDRQIDLVAPKLIVALGKSAIVRLLETDAAVASLRGKVHRYRGIPVVVTYHPAYLLRSLPEKAKAWEDLLFARATLRSAVAA